MAARPAVARIPPVWQDVAWPACASFPGGTMRADVAIVGAGFAGLSAALHILDRRPGARVVALEAGRLGAGASGRTTGMLAPGVGQSLLALCRRFGRDRAAALYRATLDAVGDVRRLVESEGIECELALSGQLVVGRTAGGSARLARLAALLDDLQLPVERLDDDGLSRTLRLGEGGGRGGRAGSRERGVAAVRLPVAGTLHPGKLVAGLAARVMARGGMIFEGARVQPLPDGRPARLCLAGGGEVIAEDVVLATAGYTPDLGVLRGRLLPVHLQVLLTEPLPREALARIGWARREGVLDARRVFSYFRLTADDRIVFGGGAPRYLWGGRTEDDARSGNRALAALAGELARTFPAEIGGALRVAGGWTGVIGYVLDALPAIERLRRLPAALHVVGWCGHGVALSIASGAWVARMICDGAAPADLPWFRRDPPLLPTEPLRFLGFRAAVFRMAALDRVA